MVAAWQNKAQEHLKKDEVGRLAYWEVRQGRVGRGEARKGRLNPLFPQDLFFLGSRMGWKIAFEKRRKGLWAKRE